MTIVQAGSLNTAALVVPNLFVQIQQPGTILINGIPTNILGGVGVSSWGPVNSPVIVGDLAGATRIFGPITSQQGDIATFVDIAAKQGATAFALVRVTDGTDVAASVAVLSNCITFTSKYTGSRGNAIKVTVGSGSAAGTSSVVVAMPGVAAEKFDNISGSGNALWIAMANAINQGTYGLAGPSQMIVATAGVGTTAPSNATYSLASGTDGNSGVTATTQVGVDTTPRTGMYALRGTNASVACLIDCTTTSTFATQNTFGLSEGIYMVGADAAGVSIATSATTKASAGIDSYAFKWMAGDWCWYLDTTNSKRRLTSPASWAAGKLAALSPENSPLNKRIDAIIGTQSSDANVVYSDAELQVAGLAGIDVIANPSPGGKYFSCRFGHNTSSVGVTHGDNYTRMTNFLASTLNASMGYFIGRLNKPSRPVAYATLVGFLSGLQQQGMIDDFAVKLDSQNNPDNRVALGYLQADVKVRYQSVIDFFLINLEGGQSVTIERKNPVAV